MKEIIKKNLYTLKTLFILKGELTPENKTALEQLGFERAHFNFLANVAKEHYLKRFGKTYIYVYDDGCCSVWGKSLRKLSSISEFERLPPKLMINYICAALND